MRYQQTRVIRSPLVRMPPAASVADGGAGRGVKQHGQREDVGRGSPVRFVVALATIGVLVAACGGPTATTTSTHGVGTLDDHSDLVDNRR